MEWRGGAVIARWGGRTGFSSLGQFLPVAVVTAKENLDEVVQEREVVQGRELLKFEAYRQGEPYRDGTTLQTSWLEAA